MDISTINRESLINQVAEQSSFLHTFVEEYSSECDLNAAERVFSVLGDILGCLQDGSIPETMLRRIKSMLDQLKINDLINRHNAWGGLHDFDKYLEALQNVFIGSYFAKKTFGLLKAIDFVNSNVVLIGANGSGKTMFANSIRKELERSENGIVIPAQKMLIFPTYSHIPTYQHAYSAYNDRIKGVLDDKQTFNASKDDDVPYSIIKTYGSEMMVLLSTLLGERVAKRNQFCSGAKDGDIVDTEKFRSVLDEVIEIWNDLIGHRKLLCDDSSNLVIQNGDKQYPAYKMSDGEREIFYVVGRVLLAKESALIVVDEPELHLHKSILNKLWDKLEERRKDCQFIYLTHDIDFAASRSAKKCWLKSYNSEVIEEWDLEPLDEGIIPEHLLMMILGSRKRILFCEGVNHSLDNQVFEILFPDYTIVPVNTCKDVINYTRAYNKLENKYSEAFGIIDKDFRTEEQLAKLSSEKVFSYDVAEIENLFLVEEFIEGFAAYKKEKCNLADIKERIISAFEKDIELQASLFVTQKINTVFNESHIRSGKTKEDVEHSFSDFTSKIDIEKWYSDRKAKLEAIVSDKDYKKAIFAYNNKGLHSIIEKALGLSCYGRKAIEYLKDSEEAKRILRSYFPSIIVEKHENN